MTCSFVAHVTDVSLLVHRLISKCCCEWFYLPQQDATWLAGFCKPDIICGNAEVDGCLEWNLNCPSSENLYSIIMDKKPHVGFVFIFSFCRNVSREDWASVLF